MKLDISVWVDDYNHNMNSVDLVNQFHEAYNTQQIMYQNWLPLLHWILNQVAINTYKLDIFGKDLGQVISKVWVSEVIKNALHRLFNLLIY